MAIVENIRQICRAKGLQIVRLESECGFARSTIRRWDNVSPSIDKIIRVADVLDCSIDELCGRMYYVEQQEKATDAALEQMIDFQNELQARNPANLSEDEQLIIMKFRMLSDADKVKLLFQIMRFAEKEEIK